MSGLVTRPIDRADAAVIDGLDLSDMGGKLATLGSTHV